VTITGANDDINVWTGHGATRDWNDANNWSLGHAPRSSEQVRLDTSATIHLTSNVTIAGLLIAAGATVDIANSAFPHILNVTSGLVSSGIIAATNHFHQLLIDTGRGSFINDGLVVSMSNSGLEIQGDVVNHGTLEAQAGRLSVDGDVTGHGRALIDGGTLEFGGCSDADVMFSGCSSDLLLLDRGSHFTGSISGLLNGDTIDLSGIAPWQVHTHQSPGVVEVHYGYDQNDFFTITDPAVINHLSFSSDHHGGTEIVWTNHAPVFNTENVRLVHNGSHMAITGLTVADSDAGSTEAYSLTIGTTTRQGKIDHILDNEIDVSGTNGRVPVTITDSFGATDNVTFIFNTNPNPSHGAVNLVGTAGDDVILASNFNDTLTGGSGSDQFVFSRAAGRDTITDFNHNQHDRIDISALVDTNDIEHWMQHHVSSHESETLIAIDSQHTITLHNVSHLFASDFIVHSGGGSSA
jgi:hypothetical protein